MVSVVAVPVGQLTRVPMHPFSGYTGAFEPAKLWAHVRPPESATSRAPTTLVERAYPDTAEPADRWWPDHRFVLHAGHGLRNDRRPERSAVVRNRAHRGHDAHDHSTGGASARQYGDVVGRGDPATIAINSAADFERATTGAGSTTRTAGTRTRSVRRTGESVRLQLLLGLVHQQSPQRYLQLFELHSEFLEWRRLCDPMSGRHVQ